MGKSIRILLLSGFLVMSGAIAAAQTTAPAKPQAAAPSQHTMLAPDQMKWGPAPPSLPPGAQMAVLQGK